MSNVLRQSVFFFFFFTIKDGFVYGSHSHIGCSHVEGRMNIIWCVGVILGA